MFGQDRATSAHADPHAPAASVSMPTRLLFGALAALLIPAAASAQPSPSSYADQQQYADVLYGRRQPLATLPVVRYTRVRLADPTGSGSSLRARLALYETVGEGDAELGRQRLALTPLLNGVEITQLSVGDEVVLPDRPEHFELDARAYTPFPFYYPGAAAQAKLVVVDLTLQVWAAYEHGELDRWGPVSTGKVSTPTPTGRFTMNWREEERNSTAAPPGEEWHMRWVMNIQQSRGIHMHQYAMPQGAPEGHGCIRMVEADAKWLWDWSDPWTTTAGRGVNAGRRTAPGTPVVVIGETPGAAPERFGIWDGVPVRISVALPRDPMRAGG